jgi:hypothetical protein
VNDKKSIGKEILYWIDRDEQYTRLLIPYALSVGAITEDEAEKCKADLNAYYADKPKTKKNELGNLIPSIGFAMTKILYNIVDQLPQYQAYDTTLYAHDTKIIKSFDKMGTMAYYSMVDSLQTMGFITKGKHDKKKTYTINFKVIEEAIKTAKKSDKNRELQNA